jgi:hypothetical protein
MLVRVRHSCHGLDLRRDHARSIPPTVGDTLGADQNLATVSSRNRVEMLAMITRVSLDLVVRWLPMSRHRDHFK